MILANLNTLPSTIRKNQIPNSPPLNENHYFCFLKPLPTIFSFGANVLKIDFSPVSAVVAYSAPAAYPYAYSSYNSYPYSAWPAAYPVSAYSYSTYHGYPSYAYDDGKYWPGKYEKAYYPALKTAYPGYPYYY